MCGRDEFGVTEIRGVKGLAAGLSTNFLTKLIESLLLLLFVLLLLFRFVLEVDDNGVLCVGGCCELGVCDC